MQLALGHNMGKSLLLASIFLFQFSDIAYAGWLDKIFGYGSYEECILDKMSSASNKFAAISIRSACRKVTSEKKENNCAKLSKLKNDIIKVENEKIALTKNIISMPVYNSSSEYKIKRLDMKILYKKGTEDFSRTISDDMEIDTLDYGSFFKRIPVALPKSFNFEIVGVYGCKD
jgi:hypothetical protein